MTVVGRRDTKLLVGNRRFDSPGAKLLNLKRLEKSPGSHDPQDLATLFLPRGSFKTLFRNLEDYESWSYSGVEDDEPEGEDEEAVPKRPRNFWLFESACQIRIAGLEDYWTDVANPTPRRDVRVAWEVWVRTNAEPYLLAAQTDLDLVGEGRDSRFINVVVKTIFATPDEISQLARSSAAIIGLRRASTFAASYLDMGPPDRAQTADDYAARIVPAPAGAPRIALLDTGVERRNPLLSASLTRNRCWAVEPSWATGDHDGHGTKMAGVALFGDLMDPAFASGPIRMPAALESIVVTTPPDAYPVRARDAIERSVVLVEAEPNARVFCLAATARGEAEDGSPTSTSTMVDKLAYNDGTRTRLFVAAVGNVETSEDAPYAVAGYGGRNRDHGIQSPAQAMNGLSVGAATFKDVHRASVAPVGDLSPTSRTAQSWLPPHPNKPDIVMEGGNHSHDPGGRHSRPRHDDCILTTSRAGPRSPLAYTGESSAATAAAAGICARVMARYPDFRMETVRGLVVHSARWTDAMREQQAKWRAEGLSAAEVTAATFACYGWGAPNEDALFRSAGDALTLIMEDEIQPYAKPNATIRLKETRFFDLPWPKRVLKTLNQIEVEMRCTLSHFIEPEANAPSRDRLDRYPSHRLRFDLKRFDETQGQARLRVNAPAEGLDRPNTRDDGWLLGPRTLYRGGLQQDVWRGPAFRLAERDAIQIIPAKGWWADRAGAKRFDRPVRFSLIVSIATPPSALNLYLEARASIPAGLLVESPAVAVV